MALHYTGGIDLGVGGISYVELLMLYELWAGERLTLEKAHHRYLRPVVNHDGFGGTAPDPMVWSAGSLPKRRRIVHAVS